MTSSTSEYNQSAKKEQPKFYNLWEYPLFLKDENGRLKKRVQLLEAAMALTQGARVHMLEFFPGAAGVDLSTLLSRKRPHVPQPAGGGPSV